MTPLTDRLVDDALWEQVAPLIPPPPPPRGPGGRPRVPDRCALEGIVFVLATGCRWRDLPADRGWGSGVTCWRRLRDWHESGVWEQLEPSILDRVGRLRHAQAAPDSPGA